MLLAWLRESLPARLNLSSECAFLGQVHADSIHPNALGRVLFADYLTAYVAAAEHAVLEANVLRRCASVNSSDSSSRNSMSRRPAFAGCSGALADEACGVSPLPAVALHPDAEYFSMRCYGFGEHWSNSFIAVEFRPNANEADLLGAVQPLNIVNGSGWEFHEYQVNGDTKHRYRAPLAVLAFFSPAPIYAALFSLIFTCCLPCKERLTSFSYRHADIHACLLCRKPGWVATAAGSTVDIAIDTHFDEAGSAAANSSSGQQPTAGSSNAAFQMPRMRGSANGSPSSTGGSALSHMSIVVSYLRSYEHMGRAQLSCVAGCSCNASVIDAHHSDRSSVVQLHEVAVTPHKRCVVRLAVLSETSSLDGEHKFKLIQIVARASNRLLVKV